jgi:peptidoglycan LD-endopeptidase CwlK
MRACLRSWFSRQFFNLANCRRFWHNSPTSGHVGNDAGVNGNVGSRRTSLVRKNERRSKMSFKLSQRSLGKLDGVHPKLQEVVKLAIGYTNVDFGVTYGVRSLEEQERLYKSGRSQTMKSKHLLQDDGFCHAVDVVAYDGSDVVWEINVYDDICDAFKKAAIEVGLPIKWGAAWSEGDIRTYEGTAEDAMNAYIDLRRSQSRRPFIDGPHFEVIA